MAYAGLWQCFVIGFLLMSPFTAQAKEFTFVWEDTILNTDNLPPGVEQFDTFTFSITVNNFDLSESSASQIWDAADFVSIALDVDNGDYTGTSSAIDVGASGTFATDGMSNIISVPTAWVSTTASGTDNQTGKFFNLFINGANAFWVDSDPQPPFILNAKMASLNTSPSSWTLSTQTSSFGFVPEPSTFALAVLGLVGLTFVRRPRRR
ncbi:MAG: PEP-CTERM sorting domain-containing protein [Planctomycetota bacterium]|nr:PEP-CTERM sorting domain-containing protein [Planctomycetota bacterium]